MDNPMMHQQPPAYVQKVTGAERKRLERLGTVPSKLEKALKNKQKKAQEKAAANNAAGIQYPTSHVQGPVLANQNVDGQSQAYNKRIGYESDSKGRSASKSVAGATESISQIEKMLSLPTNRVELVAITGRPFGEAAAPEPKKDKPKKESSVSIAKSLDQPFYEQRDEQRASGLWVPDSHIEVVEGPFWGDKGNVKGNELSVSGLVHALGFLAIDGKLKHLYKDSNDGLEQFHETALSGDLGLILRSNFGLKGVDFTLGGRFIAEGEKYNPIRYFIENYQAFGWAVEAGVGVGHVAGNDNSKGSVRIVGRLYGTQGNEKDTTKDLFTGNDIEATEKVLGGEIKALGSIVLTEWLRAYAEVMAAYQDRRMTFNDSTGMKQTTLFSQGVGEIGFAIDYGKDGIEDITLAIGGGYNRLNMKGAITPNGSLDKEFWNMNERIIWLPLSSENTRLGIGFEHNYNREGDDRNQVRPILYFQHKF